MDVGVTPLESGGYRFTLWLPVSESVALKLVAPRQEIIPMQPAELGYWNTVVSGLQSDARYCYLIDGTPYPDPASRYQPEGVHGPSAIVNHQQYVWHDAGWKNIEIADYIIYELHIGTFTQEGTFAAAARRLTDLKTLGVTAIEIMPVAQFPGERNWGYDGVYPYAVQNSYGGPEGLKQFVDACHQEGLAVIMDVVYNHFGPEGNYTGSIGPYTTPKYTTPWGSAINFDDAWSEGVRQYFLQNALSWLRDYHIDALRLDAVHAIYDFGAKHFLADLTERVEILSQNCNKPHYLIAESDLNDSRLIRDRNSGGYGLDAQWSDDFHHALHTLLTGERNGYYNDFGSCEALAIALRERFVYSWKYSKFRQRFHGNSARDLPTSKFVICAQNHDQVGNRMLGERLTQLIPFEGLKLSAGILLTAPYVPMLFMGEEYGEDAPFLYFVDHGDPDLIEAVRKGRANEFKDFQSDKGPPDAASPETYQRSTLNWSAWQQGKQQQLRQYYQRLIQLRKQLDMATCPGDIDISSQEEPKVLYYQRSTNSGRLLCLMNFERHTAKLDLPEFYGSWQKEIDSTEPDWGGAGTALPSSINGPEFLTLPPLSFALYSQY
ncbi:MAG: malto-oligosyltrehalose trehalohydrolase [Cyanobacteria bacterium J06627_3]